MRKILFSLALSAIALAGCQKSENDITITEKDTFTASVELFSIPTKTSMTPEKYIVWSQNDCIAIFKGNTVPYKYEVTDESVGNAKASFARVVSESGDNFIGGTEIPSNVAFYPYHDGCILTGAALEDQSAKYEISGFSLPAEQEYTANSFANGTFPMVAVTEDLDDHILAFKNVLGAIKLQLKGTQTVKSVKITGKNNEILSGTATVSVYTNGQTPTINMTASDEASKSMTLNCGEGINLSEINATEFIIALPPVTFSKGFTVTVTDSKGNEQTIETKIPNEIWRSSILIMPEVTLEDTSDDNDIYIEVIYIDKSSLTMAPGTSYKFETEYYPYEVTNNTLTWISSDNRVARINSDGKVDALSTGVATITVRANGGAYITSIVTVKAPVEARVDYVDETGKNHGKGIAIGTVVWAPVNCGYESSDEDNNGYPYGKLYQWGRKYGQGYNSSDAISPEIAAGPVMPLTGNSVDNKNKYYIVSESPYDWCKVPDNKFWNDDSGNKTQSDPCPDGWRVPTYQELEELGKNYSAWDKDDSNQNGRYFSGIYDYIDGAPKIFLSAAGRLFYSGGEACDRGDYGYYWSSSPTYSGGASMLPVGSSMSVMMSGDSRACGYSVRCVQE